MLWSLEQHVHTHYLFICTLSECRLKYVSSRSYVTIICSFVVRSEAHVLFPIRSLRLCQSYLAFGTAIHNHLEFFFLWRYSPNLGLGLPP
jgi:hypothetical protein